MATENKKLLRERGKANANEEVLSSYQVATLLKMKVDAIRKAVKNGVIPALKIGNRWRFSKLAVLESLNVKK